MKQQLVRLFYPYGSTRRVLRGPARGMRFVVEDGIGFTYAIGTETAAPSHFAQHVKPGMTVYDVGANRGQMMLLFASLVGPGGRVVAFEPAPSVYPSLVRNIEINDLGYVRAINVAAADAVGELEFAFAAGSPTQGKLVDVEQTYTVAGAEVFSVPTLPLDDVLADEPPPDFIKIDVEGAGASVLRGAARILDDHGPVIFMELHGPEEQAGIRDELFSRGYVATKLDGTVVPDTVTHWSSPLWLQKKA